MEDFSEARDRIAAAYGEAPEKVISDKVLGRLLLRKSGIPRRERRLLQITSRQRGEKVDKETIKQMLRWRSD